MKPRIHYLMLFFLVVLPATSGRCYSQSITTITESDINAMLIAMDRAARKGDVDGVIAHFAPGIKIKMSVLNKGSDREQEATLTKEEYASNARQNMRRKLSYQNERKNTRIKIYDDETAMVTCDIYEVLKLPEGTLRSASSEVAYLTLRDGKIVITGIEARMRVY
jgi:hypothetical protein